MAVFEFDRALVRAPATSVTNGLRAGSHDGPTYAGVAEEHRAYVAALEQAGVAVEVLPPLPDFPDSVFIEDPAFVMPQAALLLRPGASSREGEAAELSPDLLDRFEHVAMLDEGRADGGDILVLPGEVLIGLSARTDRRGAKAFASWAKRLGLSVRIVEPPPGVLHLKSACSLIDEGTGIATRALADAAIFNGLEVVLTPDDEEAAANLLRVNDRILVSAGHARTADLLAARGLKVVPLETRAIETLDAGLSCMSLRWKGG